MKHIVLIIALFVAAACGDAAEKQAAPGKESNEAVQLNVAYEPDLGGPSFDDDRYSWCALQDGAFEFEPSPDTGFCLWMMVDGNAECIDQTREYDATLYTTWCES